MPSIDELLLGPGEHQVSDGLVSRLPTCTTCTKHEHHLATVALFPIYSLKSPIPSFGVANSISFSIAAFKFQLGVYGFCLTVVYCSARPQVALIAFKGTLMPCQDSSAAVPSKIVVAISIVSGTSLYHQCRTLPCSWKFSAFHRHNITQSG